MITTLSLSRAPAPLVRLALTAMAPAAWGTTYVVTTHLLPPGHLFYAALLRTLPAGLLAMALTRQLPIGSWWWRSLVLGGLNMGAFSPLLFVAAQRLPGWVAATLGAVQLLFIAFLAAAVLPERLSTQRSGWGVVGIGLVVLSPAARLDPLGVAAGLGGAASMATGVVFTKRWRRPAGASAVTLAGWQLTGGGLLLLLPALLVDGVPPGIDARATAGYLWLGLSAPS